MILDTIVEATKKRVLAAREQTPYRELRNKAMLLPHDDFRFERALRMQKFAFICEVKRASPSKGLLVQDFPYIDIALQYEDGGASAVSVLTEPEFFLGSDRYLTEIRAAVETPVLRKDFIIDEYQLFEAKVIGADAVLLICALLDTATLRRYLSICEALGLSALVEAHTEDEVKDAVAAGALIIGVNNRNLKTFEVDLNTCLRLRKTVPLDILFVAESGIQTPQDIIRLYEAGIDAALVGEALMKSPNKSVALSILRSGLPR